MENEKKDNMKIAVVGTYDVTKVNYWSGTASYIFKLLQRNFQTSPIQVSFKRPVLSLIKGLYYNKVLKQTYLSIFDLSVYRYNESHLDRYFNEEFDLIVTYEYAIVPSIAKYGKHVMLISDATFDNLLNYYDYRSGLCAASVEDAHTLQKNALSAVDYALYSSEWAIANAASRYGTSRSKLKTLFYGSNLTDCLAYGDIDAVISRRLADDVINLFFPATVWERKGGTYAIGIVNRLNELGHRAKLIIAGCKVPEEHINEHVINIGFLDKRILAEEAKLKDCYKQSHFLILPSKADCTPIVFSEANSFALPIITSNTGGIRSIVNELHNNGIALELNESFVEVATRYVVDTLADQEAYKRKCYDSYQAFKENLDWAVGEKMLVSLIEGLKRSGKTLSKT